MQLPYHLIFLHVVIITTVKRKYYNLVLGWTLEQLCSIAFRLEVLRQWKLGPGSQVDCYAGKQAMFGFVKIQNKIESCMLAQTFKRYIFDKLRRHKMFIFKLNGQLSWNRYKICYTNKIKSFNSFFSSIGLRSIRDSVLKLQLKKALKFWITQNSGK